MPGPAPTAEHGSAAKYRSGCRCTPCRGAHAKEHQAKRDTRFEPGAPMGPEVRGRILELIAGGSTVKAAAAELGLTHQAVYGAAKALPAFGEQINRLTISKDS